MKKKKKAKIRKLPDISYLLEHYRYDPINGILYQKDSYGIDDETIPGWEQQGYRYISIRGKSYAVHRIVFYMFHRRDPKQRVIDHIDGDRSNNVIVNLRCVTQRVNLTNTAAQRKKTGLPKCEPGACHVFAVEL